MELFTVITKNLKTGEKKQCDFSVQGVTAPQDIRNDLLLKMPEHDIIVIKRSIITAP